MESDGDETLKAPAMTDDTGGTKRVTSQELYKRLTHNSTMHGRRSLEIWQGDIVTLEQRIDILVIPSGDRFLSNTYAPLIDNCKASPAVTFKGSWMSEELSGFKFRHIVYLYEPTEEAYETIDRILEGIATMDKASGSTIAQRPRSIAIPVSGNPDSMEDDYLARWLVAAAKQALEEHSICGRVLLYANTEEQAKALQKASTEVVSLWSDEGGDAARIQELEEELCALKKKRKEASYGALKLPPFAAGDQPASPPAISVQQDSASRTFNVMESLAQAAGICMQQQPGAVVENDFATGPGLIQNFEDDQGVELERKLQNNESSEVAGANDVILGETWPPNEISRFYKDTMRKKRLIRRGRAFLSDEVARSFGVAGPIKFLKSIEKSRGCIDCQDLNKGKKPLAAIRNSGSGILLLEACDNCILKDSRNRTRTDRKINKRKAAAISLSEKGGLGNKNDDESGSETDKNDKAWGRNYAGLVSKSDDESGNETDDSCFASPSHPRQESGRNEYKQRQIVGSKKRRLNESNANNTHDRVPSRNPEKSRETLHSDSEESRDSNEKIRKERNLRIAMLKQEREMYQLQLEVEQLRAQTKKRINGAGKNGD